jgi:hypothetical protein
VNQNSDLLWIKGSQIIDLLQPNGLDLAKIHVAPEQKYFIPPELIENEQLVLSLDVLPQLIEFNQAPF